MAAGSAEVLVVGGGPTGLAAALGAARRGCSVHLVEASERLGGMAASINVGGQRVDLGSHRLHPSAPPAVAELLDELLGDDLQTRTRNGRLHLAGAWVPFPFGPLDLARNLPWRRATPIVRDLLVRSIPRAGSGDVVSYADVVRTGLGPSALATFHGPMAAKLWGRPAEELAAELAQRRIAVSSPGAVLARLARSSRPGGRVFRYPRLGYGQVGERLAEAAVEAGVQIHTGTRPDRLRPGSDLVTVGLDGHEATYRRVLWTASPADLALATGHEPPVGPDHRGLVLVYLVVPRSRYSPIDAHYVPDREVVFSRLSEPKNYRDGPDPAGLTVLCAEVPATVGDRHWSADPGDLADEVTDGMGRLGLEVPVVEATEARRLPRVYPLLTAADPGGADAQRAAVLARADSLEGVTLLGRQALIVGDNLHHVLDMGLTAASCLRRGGDWHHARWEAARRRFDGFVVDD